MAGLLFLLTLIVVPQLSAVGASAAETETVDVEGTQFKVTKSDGSVLHSPDLVGAILTIARDGGTARLRIDAVERDPDARRGEVWLHTFSIQASDGSWQLLCSPGPDGRTQGFPIAGRVRADGLLERAEAGAFHVACTSGAQGKCIRFGYLPWARGSSSAQSDLYNACVRMVRADYCGDGSATTREGMPIDPYDDLGIRKSRNLPGMAFEAAWTSEGAVCVRRVRVKENVSPESLVASCPRLADRVGPRCTEDEARALGARLFNRSAQ